MELTKNNEIITFEVVGDRESKGNFYYAINYKGQECWVKKHLSQIKYDTHPKNIECSFVGYDNLGRPRFVQNRASILNNIYEVGVEYTFTVEQKERDNNSNVDFFVVIDEYNDRHRLYFFDQNSAPAINTSLQCRVEKIDLQKGRLTLIQASLVSQDAAKEKKWYDPKTVFNEIGEKDSFITLFNDYATSTEKDLTKQQQELIHNFAAKHNNWVFSYLNFVDQVLVHKFVENGDYVSLELFTDISLKFQYWLLEGSDFLSCYHYSVKEDAIVRSKSQIAKFEAQKNAIAILKKGNQTDFINSLLKKLRASGRLVYKKQEYIETLIKLLFIDSDTIQSKISELTELFALLTINETIEEYHKSIIIKYLDRKINNENHQLNKLLHFSLYQVEQEEYQHRIETIIQIIATQILLEDKKSITVRRRKSQFYRFISYLSKGEEALTLVKLSLDSLTGRINDENIFMWENIIEFNLENILSKITEIHRIVPHENDSKYYFKSKRGVIIIDKNINIASFPGANKADHDLSTFKIVHSLMNKRFNVCVIDREHNWTRAKDFSSIKSQWDNYLKCSKSSRRPTFELDDEIFVEVKPNNKNGKLIFVKILSDLNCNKDAAVYAGDICSQWINDVSSLCNGGEILKARIKLIDEEGKIGLSIREYTANFENQYSDARDIFQEYANQCKLEYDNINNLFDIDDQDDNQDAVDKRFCDEIVYIIDSFIKLEKDPISRFELLNFAQLASLLIADSKSLYYKYYILYLMNIDSFSRSESGYIEEDNAPKRRDFALNLFSELRDKQLIVDLLKEYHNQNISPVLFDLAIKSEKDDLHTKVAKAIFADKILRSIDYNASTKLSVKKLINTLIRGDANETLTPLLAEVKNNDTPDIGRFNNFGSEGLYKEFKTSFVYSSISNDYNIEEQSAIIMRTIAGFLNASGGEIYIGVDDNGTIKGIQNDLDMTGDNLDKYQRRIQQCIVDSFNKDVNSTISISFKRYNPNTVCIITIPKYHQPVTFKNEFWQRQGNETRVIKGDDLVPFILRHTNMVTSNIPSFASNEQFDVKNKDSSDYQNGDESSNEDHFDIVKEKNDEVVFLEENDEVVTKEDEVDLLFHWNIYKDGTYVISEDAKVDVNLFISIPLIDTKSENGYVLQCYDNGCVNKVAVRTLFGKQKNKVYKNGMNNSEGVNLKNVFMIPQDCIILVESTKNNQKFIKGYKTSYIAAHTGLQLKGNQIVSSKIENARYYILDEEFAVNVQSIMYDSSIPIGKDVTNDKIKQAIDFLNNSGIKIGMD